MREIHLIHKLTNRGFWFSAVLTAIFILNTQIGFGQNPAREKIDVNINTNGSGTDTSGWYAQPWVWVVGVAIFVLLVIMLTRSPKRNYKQS
jgi:hypothetical protein